MTASAGMGDANAIAGTGGTGPSPARVTVTRLALATAVLAATAACDLPQDGQGTQDCSPRAYTRLVGQKADMVKLPAGLEHRTFQRGSMITMDFNDDRLNLVTDANGVIVAVTCG